MALFSFPKQVNEHAARLVAAVVAISLGLALTLDVPAVVPVLAVGFFLRVGWGPRFSPLARTAVALAGRLWSPRQVPGKPKRFAQGIGAACTVTASVLLATGHRTAGWTVVGMVVVFATLEAVFAFCAGCWLYGQGERLGVLPPADT